MQTKAFNPMAFNTGPKNTPWTPNVIAADSPGMSGGIFKNASYNPSAPPEVFGSAPQQTNTPWYMPEVFGTAPHSATPLYTPATPLNADPFSHLTTKPEGNWWDGILGSKDKNGLETQGWGGLALGAASGLFNGWAGMQQMELAKKTFEQNKLNSDRNYAAQRSTINASLEDRQRARVASNSGAYESVGSYLDKNRIA